MFLTYFEFGLDFVLVEFVKESKKKKKLFVDVIKRDQKIGALKFHTKGLGTSTCLIYKMAELSFASSSGLETHTIPLKER